MTIARRGLPGTGLLAVLMAGLLAMLVSARAMSDADGPPPRASFDGPRLLMFEDEACPWCERFKEEILPYYHKTEEGRRVPLRMVDVHEPLPPDLKHIRRVVYTPTFVLMDAQGHEVGRIEGYPGEEFFWFRLEKLLRKLDEHKEAKSAMNAAREAEAVSR